MILAVDTGNSRTKWSVFDDNGAPLAQGAEGNQDIGLLATVLRDFPGCRRAVVSNVAGEAVAARLSALFEALNLPVLWARSRAIACGVKNGYLRPEQLGTDRWASLIAAWNTYHMPCVIATAGTALTVDALSGQGEFLGGLILPGLTLMREALAAGTAAVPSAYGQWRDFPATTADAVLTGSLTAMAGAVQHMCALLQMREGQVPHCLLSGGDAEQLSAALARPTLVMPNLVLQGLFLLEKTAV